jgi:hypothetical protein
MPTHNDTGIPNKRGAQHPLARAFGAWARAGWWVWGVLRERASAPDLEGALLRSEQLLFSSQHGLVL